MADKRGAVLHSMGSVKEKDKPAEKRHVHSIHIERADSGGYIAHHTMRGDKTGASSDGGKHVIADPEALQDHVAATMGDQPPADPNPAAAGGDPNAGGAPADNPPAAAAAGMQA